MFCNAKYCFESCLNYILRGFELSNVLAQMLRPKSIAIIGASPDANKLNGRPFYFLRRDGYAGKLYPVNPKYTEIDGIPCYPNVTSLPEAPELAVIIVSQKLVSAVIEELGKIGTPVCIIFSSGYSEIGPEGVMLEQELLKTAEHHGIRICGPNNLGLINAFENITATFSQYADKPPIAGPVGFASQSGAFGTGISALARSRGIGLGYFVNTGNQADITLVDALIEIADDPKITVLSAYIEGIRNGTELIRLAHKAMEVSKPLIITKVGRKAAGARAAASHTGSLAGEDRVFDGVLRQYGVIRARNEEHMLDLVAAFTCCHIPTGKGVALITQSGGAGVLMADRCEELGLEVTEPTAKTRKKLQTIIPPFGSTQNPIDVTGQFVAEPKILIDSIKIALDDPGIDSCIVWLQLMHAYSGLLVNIFKKSNKKLTKPLIICWLGAPVKALQELREAGIYVIGATERSVDVVAGLVQYGQSRARHVKLLPPLADPNFGNGRGQASPAPSIKAAELLNKAGIPLAPAAIATDAQSAQRIAEKIGYPVAIKIESPNILHKTDAGGVCLNLTDATSLVNAVTAILKAAKTYNPKAKIDGLLVQKMMKPATELVLGVRRDAVFGPVVMVGLGGIFIEILEDVAFAAVPINSAQAGLMLDSLQGKALLEGARGKAPVNRTALIKLICNLSQFAANHPEIVELDLNPVFADGENLVAVDWLMMVD
jgi:acyl-CoA synthetase (NDP forming)